MHIAEFQSIEPPGTQLSPPADFGGHLYHFSLQTASEGHDREKESGQLHWPNVSQELRHQGSRFRFGLVCNCDDCSFTSVRHYLLAGTKGVGFVLADSPFLKSKYFLAESASSYLPHPFHPFRCQNTKYSSSNFTYSLPSMPEALSLSFEPADCFDH